MLQGGVYERSDRPGRYRVRVRVWRDGPRHVSIKLTPAQAAAVEQLIAYWRSPEGVAEWRRLDQERCERFHAAVVGPMRIRDVDEAHDLALEENQLRTVPPRPSGPTPRSEDIHRPVEKIIPITPGNVRGRLVWTGQAIEAELRTFDDIKRAVLRDVAPFMPLPELDVRERDAEALSRVIIEVGKDAWRRLDPFLRHDLKKLKPVLVTNGSVMERGERDRRPAYRLRARVPDDYCGRIQVSMPIEPDQVALVRLVIAGWREPARAAKRREKEWEYREKMARSWVRMYLRSIRMAGENSVFVDDLRTWATVYLAAKRGVPLWQQADC